MARVLTCVTWNETAQQCDVEAWVEQTSPWLEAMPTVEQANTVGAAIFVSLLTLAVIKSLTQPPRDNE
ncbi:hypothetical protein [Lysobacter sp. ESA13C]|uniref:hypothetical protein n=1 Tax=Lysobacter sp. ESA13C TaxID=2862676 RepID=UPI001CC0B6DF|nr:hypothetical protein [Lysobacter sp. ESA13C]